MAYHVVYIRNAKLGVFAWRKVGGDADPEALKQFVRDHFAGWDFKIEEG